MSERAAVLDLEQQRRAAEALRDTLSKLPAIDECTLRDMIEGETNLHETIAEVVSILTHTEAMAEGLKGKIEELQTRKARYDNRVAFLRSSIEQAMVIGDIRKMELPDATLSLSTRAPGVMIIDEASVPAKFWKQAEPTIDKVALKAALKDKEEIPGAVLGNGSVSLTLTVRRA